MDLALRPSGGQHLVLRPQARPYWYAPATVDAHEVELFMHEVDAQTGAALGSPVSLGRFHPEALVTIPYNPVSDKNVRLYAQPYSATGGRGYSSLADAEQATVLFQRDTAAPSVEQVGAATTDQIRLAVSGFTRFARTRRVRIADNASMSGAQSFVTDAGSEALPSVLDIARAAASFTPSDLAGCVLWLRADSLALSDGDPVSTWQDSSGSGNHAAQGTAAQQPLYRTNIVGGRPALLFDGTNDLLDAGTDPALDLTQATIFAVCKATARRLCAVLDMADPAGPSEDYALLLNDNAGADQVLFQWNSGGFQSVSGAVSYLGEWMALALRHDGAGGHVDLFKNGASALSASGRPALTGTASNRLKVGYYQVGSSGYFQGYIAELVVYAGALSDSDRQRVERYLADKYGLTTAAPAAQLAQTIYVAVAHSSGGAYGAESAPAAFTFADSNQAGGSTGEADPFLPGKISIE